MRPDQEPKLMNWTLPMTSWAGQGVRHMQKLHHVSLVDHSRSRERSSRSSAGRSAMSAGRRRPAARTPSRRIHHRQSQPAASASSAACCTHWLRSCGRCYTVAGRDQPTRCGLTGSGWLTDDGQTGDCCVLTHPPPVPTRRTQRCASAASLNRNETERVDAELHVSPGRRARTYG